MKPTLEELKNCFVWTQHDADIQWFEFIGANIHKITEQDIEGKCVLDIGANVGFASLVFLHRGAKKVVSVEANYLNYVELVKNVQPWPQIIPLYIAASDGVCKMVRILEEKGISKTVSDDSGNVKAASLHDLISANFDPYDNNLVLKCDIEGGEYDFLLSAAKSDIIRFSNIFLETHQTPHLNKIPARKRQFLLDYLELFGYEMVSQAPFCTWYYNADGSVNSCIPLEDQGSAKLIRQ